MVSYHGCLCFSIILIFLGHKWMLIFSFVLFSCDINSSLFWTPRLHIVELFRVVLFFAVVKRKLKQIEVELLQVLKSEKRFSIYTICSDIQQEYTKRKIQTRAQISNKIDPTGGPNSSSLSLFDYLILFWLILTLFFRFELN